MTSFSVNIRQACANELLLLRHFEADSELFGENALRNAVRRYETCWLPMQAMEPDSNVIPPLDVYLVWHAHMLRPHAYQKDCLVIVDHIVDHKLMPLTEHIAQVDASAAKWQEYNPHEPFGWKESLKDGVLPYEQKSCYDLIAAVGRQRKFSSKIMAMNLSPQDLQEAVEKYEKFLKLLAAYPGQPLSPSLVVDLAWHAHQLHPLAYADDCHGLDGKLIGHNDEGGDPNGITKKLWKAHYGEPMLTEVGSCGSDCDGTCKSTSRKEVTGCGGGCSGDCQAFQDDSGNKSICSGCETETAVAYD
ncbi:Protein F32B5.7 [Aphelenchoides avenae]|nr:Protein F32B5.7 [Aphelenchus avenae]